MTKKVENKTMVRINGLMPSNLKKEVEEWALEEGTTFSQIIRVACIHYLRMVKNDR